MDNYCIFAAVPITLVDFLWSKMEPYLINVVEVSHNEITLDSLKNRLLSGDTMAVLVISDKEIIAVNMLEIRIFDSGIRAMYIPVVGGTNMDKWADRFLEFAKAVAKDLDCTELRGLAARKGWVRYLADKGWEEVNVALRCEL